MPGGNRYRVAVVGARRNRQGIGEFVARAFHSAGAEVCAVAGSTEESAGEASENLRKRYGIEAAPFSSVEGMLGESGANIAAICSPTRLHREHLEAASRFPVHVLCEKPLWWGERIREGTEALLDRFQGRLLRLNTQWPFTLGAFRALHGEEPFEDVRSFSMRLSPMRENEERILDSAPHLLSMLEALCGRGTLREIRWEGLRRATFAYTPEKGAPVAVEFNLETVLAPPRPAWYAINAFRVDRRIRLPEYRFEFEGGGRTVEAPDPLDLLVKDFLASVDKEYRTDRRSLLDGMIHLREIYEAGR